MLSSMLGRTEMMLTNRTIKAMTLSMIEATKLMNQTRTKPAGSRRSISHRFLAA